ncbi:MAG: glycoside hydrolase family protein [Patescibacteria group bacterium]|nr:glycoside hydrolase family protein [Patescibacteria group bacterium]
MEDLFSICHDKIEPLEGLKLHVYTDTTGHSTIGRGHLLANGISLNAANFIYNEDIENALNECKNKIDFFGELDIPRQYVLVNLCFNMGIGGLLGFEKMLGCMRLKDWAGAAYQLSNSLENKEVPNRIFPLIKIMETGQLESAN